jgi:hypothetical protein
MRGGWFRFYNDALNDPKVQCLSGDLFKAWVNLLCLASKQSGILPTISEIAYCLRLSPEAAQATVTSLGQRELLDCGEDGRWHPHNWKNRQSKSDNSTPRVQKHRLKRSRNGKETAQVTDIDREREKEFSPRKNSFSLSAAETPPPPAGSLASAPVEGALARQPPGGSVPPPRPPHSGMSPDMGDDYRAPPTNRDPDPPMTDANREALHLLNSSTPTPRPHYPTDLTDDEKRNIAIDPKFWTPAQILALRNQSGGR